MELSLSEYRQIALMSLWIALITILGVFFVFVPNIELVILTAFLAGIAMGPARGTLVALMGEALFSAFNPIGSGLGFPVLFVLQVAAVGISGFMGGVLRRLFDHVTQTWLLSLLLGLIGFLLTLVYDLLTALSMPLAAGITEGTLWGTLLSGLIFFVMHMVSNTLIFALFGPPLIRLIGDQMQLHGLRTA